MRARRVFLAALTALALAAPARADEVTLFADAILQEALEEVPKGFQAASGHTIAFRFGGSSDLARQIRSGASADLFFCADLADMQALEKDGRVSPIDRIDVLSKTTRERGPRIVYPLSLVAGAKPAAAQLRDYLVSDAARAIYEKHGFVVILDE
jgi:ABC-type molybdate transport system substrate-binding protein